MLRQDICRPTSLLWICLFVCFGRNSPPPQWARASSFMRLLDHTQRRTTVCRTPLDEWSAHRRDLYLTTHNTHSRQTSMAPMGFEPAIPASERPQTYALDRAATGTVAVVSGSIMYRVSRAKLCSWIASFYSYLELWILRPAWHNFCTPPPP